MNRDAKVIAYALGGVAIVVLPILAFLAWAFRHFSFF